MVRVRRALDFGMITTIDINGMSCVHCVRAVHTALAAVPGIATADVKVGQATVEHDGSVTMEQLRQAVDVAGYQVRGGEEQRRSLRILD
jgi:copper chaperone